jgi:hypothetical protein
MGGELMAILGRWTGMVSGDYSPGEHIYHYVMTPPDSSPTRSRFWLSDVPEFIRIDHPNRPAAKEGNAGGGYKGAETRAKKRAVKAIAEPKPAKEPKPHTGGQKGRAVWVWKDGLVSGFKSISDAKMKSGFTFGATSGPDFRDRGWVRFPRSGIVVWRQDCDVPDCVPRPFDFLKQGVSA